MRVLILHNRYQIPGGEDAVVQQEAGMLRENGNEVSVFEVTNDHITSSLEQMQASMDAIYARKMYQQVLRQAIRFKPEVMHVHNFFPRLSPAVYGIGDEVKCGVVQTLHNYRLLCANAQLFRDGKVCHDCLGKMLPWPGVVNGCYRGSRIGSAVVGGMASFHRLCGTWRKRVDRYILLTEFARDLFVRYTDIPPDHIVIKPNPVSDPGFRVDRENYALYVGRLSPEKGIGTLLEAIRNQDGPPLLLKIAGVGPMESEVHAAVKPGQVEYLGYKSKADIYELMQKAAVLLFPSQWYEGLPMVIAEAFGTGLPVIASKLGAMEYLIDHEVNGLLFEPGNPAALRAALARVASEPALLAKMSWNARETYLQEYRPEENVKQLLNIYKQAVNSRFDSHLL